MAAQNGTGPSSNRNFFARLHDQIAQGKHCDLIVRVHVQTPGDDDDGNTTTAKRQKKDQGSANTYTDIRALSAILCVRSEYFEKALSGDWVEATERRVELVVQSQQELEDVKLLLRLSCMDSYTHDDGVLLPFATRMRLAVLADSFMFSEAVDEIVASLPLDIGFEDAVDCCVEGRLPDILEQHPGIAGAREAMVQTLVDGIDDFQFFPKDKQYSQLIVTAVEALVKLLGPVAGFFETGLKNKVNAVPLLCKKIGCMPFYTFMRILESDKLQLTSENDAYTLMTVWYPQDEANYVYREVAKVCRYHHMSPDFLATVVSQCPLMKASGLLPSVMHASFAKRNMVGLECGFGTENRGTAPSEAEWHVTASFLRQSFQNIKLGEFVTKWCSIVAGYPAYISVGRVKEVGEQGADDSKMGIFLGIQFPRQIHCDVVDALATGVHLDIRMSWPSIDLEKQFSACYQPNATTWGSYAMLWEDSIREGSRLFIDDTFQVNVHVKYSEKNMFV